MLNAGNFPMNLLVEGATRDDLCMWMPNSEETSNIASRNTSVL